MAMLGISIYSFSSLLKNKGVQNTPAHNQCNIYQL